MAHLTVARLLDWISSFRSCIPELSWRLVTSWMESSNFATALSVDENKKAKQCDH